MVYSVEGKQDRKFSAVHNDVTFGKPEENCR